MTRQDPRPSQAPSRRAPLELPERLLRITRCLHSADILMIGFVSILSVINVVFADRIPAWWLLILINAVLTGFIVWLGYARHHCGSRILRTLHDWYVAPMVFASFKELYFMIKPIHFGRDYDDVLIAIDRWMFGVDPTHWMMQFAAPWLTELLQIAYTSFFFLFILLGYEIYRRKTYDQFHFFLFTCVYGFFLSYLGYLLLPASGPRLPVADEAHQLGGGAISGLVRAFLHVAESTTLDAFPSGHTAIAVISGVFASNLLGRNAAAAVWAWAGASPGTGPAAALWRRFGRQLQADKVASRLVPAVRQKP